jgi:hypothetical protein
MENTRDKLQKISFFVACIYRKYNKHVELQEIGSEFMTNVHKLENETALFKMFLQ